SFGELAALLPDGELLAWHPQLGLLGFEADGLLQVSDLLSTPRELLTEWNRAQPGPAFAKRLVSLTAEELPDAEQAVGGGQDDIGTEADGVDSLDDLPPAPDEPKQGAVKKAFEDFRKTIAKKVQDFTSKAPQSAGGRTWVNGLNEWANRVLDSSVLRKRKEALNRLLNLLDRDPEAGLRKAIPFGEDDSHRGRARPASELVERDIDFRLGQSGGGPGDYWDIPWEIQQQLLTKYRDLANREVRLGRHRRAAYIFGNLLGDYYAAARVLEEGGHYLEAAALHRDRLGQPLEAARCLERGGIFHQAIEIYEQHAWFEDAAKLHEKLDQKDAARNCWSKSVNKARADRNYLRAAKLTREKLEEPDEALTILHSGWDQSIQSQDCLGEWFRLSGELGRHENAATEAETLSRQEISAGRAQELVKVLAGVTSSYPDGTVRLRSADSARVLASQHLEERAPNQTQLLNSLREIDRSDRLLAHDCDRFSKSGSRRLAASGPEKSRSVQIEQVHSWQSPRLEETVVAATSGSLYLAGFDADQALAVQCWGWKSPGIATSTPTLNADIYFQPTLRGRPLLAPKPDDSKTIVHVTGSVAFKKSKAGYWEQMFGGTDWIRGSSTVAVTWGPGGLAWHVARDDSDLRLECYTADGNLVSSQSLVSVLDDPVSAHILTQAEDLSELNIGLIAAHNRCFLRIGNIVYIIGPHAASQSILMDSSIFDMAVSPEGTPPELAVAAGRGVYVYPDGQWFAPDILMTELRRPKVGFTRDGLLVGADGDACIVEDTQGKQVARLEWSHREFPVAVVPTHLPVTFGVVFADGLVRIMRVD
ncbi:MAG: tetratricopeptide repeat protein, partial [Planctomycetes bacterium]|nr:tetratricopeptide repeat protein [Planctomycetota bacterium]